MQPSALPTEAAPAQAKRVAVSGTPPVGNKADLELFLLRAKQGKESTLSELYFRAGDEELKLICYVLEDKIRTEKVAEKTAIPTGVYPVRFRKTGGIHARYKKKFAGVHKGMLEICELPNFQFVMFHIGNTIADTAGCPLIGSDYRLVNGDYQVTASTEAYLNFYGLVAGVLSKKMTVSVEIINSPQIKVV